MGTTEVIGINRRSIFTLAEARALLPVISRFTKTYSEKAQSLSEQVEKRSQGTAGDVAADQAQEAEAIRLIEDWQTKVQKLGGLPKGLWLVDFDSGEGYYCWKYPEPTIAYWHHYRDGYSKRIPVEEIPSHSHVIRSENEERTLNEAAETT